MKTVNKNPIYIIAEIGVNHNGNLGLAKKLMRESKKAGANSVKFQTFNTDEIIIKNTSKARYQINNTDNNESQYDMLKKYELSNKDYLLLLDYAKKIDIEFFSTACDIKSLNYLSNTLKLKKIKISSTDLTNIPLLLNAGSTRKQIIISSGMANIDEIDIALSALTYGFMHSDDLNISKFKISKHKNYYIKNHNYLVNKIILLHCTSEYPAPLNELNLNVIDTLKKRYQIPIGYSDHSNNPMTPIIAASMNVDAIEIHVTLDNSMEGPDHICSLNMCEFTEYVKNIRKAESILGSYHKVPTKSELKNIKTVRKSLVLSEPLEKGDKISESTLTAKRPGKGIPSINYSEYLGKTLNKNTKKNHILNKNDIKN